MRSEHIAVVGAGHMGHGIAQVFAARGHEVILFDQDADVLNSAVAAIRSNLELLCEHGLFLPEEVTRTLERIVAAGNLKETVADARFVVEAVSEDLKVKSDLFREMETLCSPITVLATATSGIGITKIAAKTKAKERVIGTHFWPPPYLIPLVEVVGGQHTLAEVKEYTCNLLRSVGKHPVLVKRDVPGLVGNRLRHALWREAISIVEHGIADPQAVDEVIKKGLGIRLSALGPLEEVDLFGLDQTFQVHNHILKFIERSAAPSPFLRHKLLSGELGVKTNRGFYCWDKEAIGRCRDALAEHLIRWNQQQNPDKP